MLGLWLWCLNAVASVPPGTVINNQARVGYISAATGFTVDSNVASITVLASTDSASLTVAGDHDINHPGDTLSLDLTLTNTSSTVLSGGQLSFTPPAGVTVTAGSGVTMHISNGIITATVPDLAPGAATVLPFKLDLSLTAALGAHVVDLSYLANGHPIASAGYTLDIEARTRARVSFLVVNDSAGTSLSIPITRYQDGSGNFVAIPAPPVSPGAAQVVTDMPLPMAVSHTYHKNETLFLRIDDPDKNRDTAVADTVLVSFEVVDPTGRVIDDEIVQLLETGPNTGCFVGYMMEKVGTPAPHDGWLAVVTNSRIDAHYGDSSDSADKVNASVLIDPYGTVFNSRTGKPIDGATVSMINADTGQPATVYGDDGVSSYPATVVSGGTVSDSGGESYTMPSGGFRFPLSSPGHYRLVISLPAGAGYAWPSQASTAALQALSGAPFAIDVGSRGETFALNPGAALHLDIPLDPLGDGLFVTKRASKDQVAVGDFLQYAVEVKDASTLTPVNGVTVTDVLPFGFKYRSGSLFVNDRPAADPAVGNDGRTLSIPVGDITAAGSATLRYVVQVATAREGEAENRASAAGTLGETSNTATARVKVREDLMRSHSLIMGEVLAQNDEGDPQGIQGVRIYLEDGTYAVTDERGRYHFEGILPGTHVVQLDTTTLPLKYDLTPPANDRYAGRPWSQFVDVQGGSLWRADFTVRLKEKLTGTAGVELETLVDLNRHSLYYKARLHATQVPLRNVRLTVLLPAGTRYVPGSSTLDGEALADPEVMDTMLVYRLGSRPANWNGLLQFAGNLAGAAAADSVSKALLTVDTPEQKNARTPTVSVPLASRDVETGREHQHYVMRWQFGPLEATLDDEARRQLDALVAQLQGVDHLRLRITGYSDNLPIRPRSRGLFRDNLALSAARAENTADYLRGALHLGVEEVSTAGRGERDPIASNASEAGRSLNRRVEIEIDGEHARREMRLIDGQTGHGGEEIKTVGLLPGEHWAENKAAAAPADPAPQFDDPWLEHAAPGLEWMLPAPGYLPAAPLVDVGIKHDPRQKLEAWINGAPVDMAHFESTHVNTAHTVAYSWWRGIGLRDGDNLIEIAVTGADGTAVERLKRVIHYSRPPVDAAFLPEQSTLIADGLTPPVIAVRLTDQDGFPAREGSSGEFALAPPYQAQLDLPEGYAVMAGAPGAKPRYVVGKDGIALIKLQPSTETGEVRLTLALMNGEHEIRAALKPVLRDWILVGFAEGTVGYNALKGSVQPLDGKAADRDIYQDGRVALYAKGQVKGDWLVTFAYDTNKQKQPDKIYQTIDPGTYYTVYGDNSSQRYDASSSDKLYLKVERDTFFALFGDYDTDLQGTHLFNYSRRLTGLKSRYADDRYEVVAFASESNQGFIKDEIRGQGISGPYRLSHGTIVINSDKVRIQVRDRFRSEVVVSERTLSQHVDYDIDYVNGTVSFREPVLSVDSNLNPVFIIVDYESYDGQNVSMTYGGRAAMQVDDKTRVGVTHINEGRVGGVARLDAVDATYQVDEHTQARVELGHSENRDPTVDDSSSAYLAEIDHRATQADLKLYASQYDPGFGVGQINGSETATRKLGAEGVYHANHRTDVKGLAYHQDNLATDASRDVAGVDTRYRAGTDTELHLGLETARDDLGNDAIQSSTLLTTGVNQKFLHQRLTVHADRDQAIGEAESVDFPARTRVGADYLITDTTQVFGEQEFANGKERDTQTTVMGIKTVPWTGSEAFTSVSQRQDGAADNTAAGVGLRQRLALTERWSMDASVEKSKTVNGASVAPFNVNVPFASGESDFTATSLGVTYNPGTWLWNLRSEYRDALTGDQWNLLSSVQTAVGNDLGLLAALSLSDANQIAGHTFSGKLSLGLAYRPTASRWLVLDKLDFIRDLRDQTADGYDSRRWVNNLNANHKRDRWQTSLQYGSKFVTETFDGNDYSGYLDLTGIETRYDLNSHWDVGVHGSVLHAWQAHQYQEAYGASVGYSFATNIWVSLGYNLRGFYDRDFSQSHFTSQGPYLQVRMKVDQQSVKDALKGWTR